MVNLQCFVLNSQISHSLLNHDLFLCLEFTNKNREKDTVMEQKHIILRFILATGKGNPFIMKTLKPYPVNSIF